MRAALCVIFLWLGLCLAGCSRNFSPKQMQLVGDGISKSIPGALVSRDFLANSGARPYLGRFFDQSDFRPNELAAAVLSYSLWRGTLHSRPEVIGSKLQLDGRPAIVVGVAEPDFAPSGAGDVWVAQP